ncbi:MAG: group II intron reverse transcriptase/maturase [Phaeodactylibacter sp.]|nr:group II intron reverse transcriptase/maturase [Phaeodactylibacter sp.]
MRKSRGQRKSQEGKQLSLFSPATKAPSQPPIGGTEKGTEQVVELLSGLERQRTLTGQVLEQIVDYGNLKRAYEQVRRNGGAAGVDEMEVATLRSWLGKNINQLRQCLLEECYQTSAVRKVEIPKPNGGIRTLGIPTAKDRMVQQSMHQVLTLYYDPHFSESSFGFRPGRSAHQAVQQAAQYISEGREWVVDIDLEKFFDKINHDRLMQRLSKGIGDKRLLRLINAFLKAGLMEGGLVEQRIAGTPQGGPLSPLLSNIVLDELDKELEKRGHKFCRYADDCNIYVSSQKAGERVMASVIKFIEKKLKLKVNRSKSGVRHCSEVKFLGYTILPEGDIRVADKSLERLKDKVRQISRRNRGVEFSQVIKELNAITTGWTNYFRLANKWLSQLKEIDRWLRRRLRCYRLKQCRRKYTIFKLLHGLGMPEPQSWYVAMRSQGWWDMSNRLAVRLAMDNEWFAQKGLRSLYTELTGKS